MSIEEARTAGMTDNKSATEGFDSEDLPRRLWGRFATFGPAYGRWMASQLGESGVSFARMKLLGTLHRSKEPIIMSGLGERLGVTPRNVTKLVDALEEEGLLRRKPHPTDRRATLIELTPEGEKTVSQEFAQHVAAGAELFEALSEDEQRELLRLMDLLYEDLRRRGIVEGTVGDCF
jgi:DNA-binding MarR family transcriptional regulator